MHTIVYLNEVYHCWSCLFQGSLHLCSPLLLLYSVRNNTCGMFIAGDGVKCSSSKWITKSSAFSVHKYGKGKVQVIWSSVTSWRSSKILYEIQLIVEANVLHWCSNMNGNELQTKYEECDFSDHISCGKNQCVCEGVFFLVQK